MLLAHMVHHHARRGSTSLRSSQRCSSEWADHPHPELELLGRQLQPDLASSFGSRPAGRCRVRRGPRRRGSLSTTCRPLAARPNVTRVCASPPEQAQKKVARVAPVENLWMSLSVFCGHVLGGSMHESSHIFDRPEPVCPLAPTTRCNVPEGHMCSWPSGG